MKCRHCGGRVRFSLGDLGSSDAPGSYWYVASVLIAVALVLLGLGWLSGWPHLIFWGGFAGVSAAILVLFSWGAMSEGYGNRCEGCGKDAPVRPWSL